jgi:plastin-1
MVDFAAAKRNYPQFSDSDLQLYADAFRDFDTDSSGSIDSNELAAVLDKIKTRYTQASLKAQIEQVDTDKNGTVEWLEFLQILDNLHKGKNTAFGNTIQNANQAVQKKVTASGGAHSYSEEEKISFCEHINSTLAGNSLVQHLLPVDPYSISELFTKCADGLLLCALINDAVPDTIDVRALNTKPGMNTYMQTENLNLAINSAKGIGCSVVNVGSKDIQDGTEHIILGLIWQIVRIGLLASITLASHPELYRLLEPGEEIGDLLKLSPEQILLRWFNYHLKQANHPRKVANFSGDIKDSECYTILLHQLDSRCDKSALSLSDPTARANKVLENADKLGCKKFVKAADIVKGNPKLNLAFVANLFNTCPGLEPLTEEEKGALDEWLFKSEGTREARAFCLWINSLGIEPLVQNLFEDLRDGLVILRVMDAIEPGIVDWKKVNTKLPLHKIKQVENCNYAVELGKKMKFSLVGIGGTDINAGNPTLTLALVWQLMRYHVLSILKSLGENVDEPKMVKWANNKVKSSGKSSEMQSFKDPSLRDSIFFLDLLNAIKNCVNYDIISGGQSDDDFMMNAKYCISIARKLGCTIFLLPEDIVEVKPKMILTLVGSIMSVGVGASHK